MKIYLCSKCGSHIVCKDNEEVKQCNWCGNEKIDRSESLPVELKTFKEVKKIDTLEIEEQFYREQIEKLHQEEKKPITEMFLDKGIVKIKYTTGDVVYNYYEADGNGGIRVECYEWLQPRKNRDYKSFLLVGTFKVTFSEDGIKYHITDILMNPAFEKEYTTEEMAKDTLEGLLTVNTIFIEISKSREIEKCKCKTIEGSEKEIEKKNGRVVVKTRKEVFINENLKIYTYDDKMASNLRGHRQIMKPFWATRQHLRHYRNKDGSVRKISVIPKHLKGKDRDKHSVDEIQISYKIKEKEYATS